MVCVGLERGSREAKKYNDKPMVEVCPPSVVAAKVGAGMHRECVDSCVDGNHLHHSCQGILCRTIEGVLKTIFYISYVCY